MIVDQAPKSNKGVIAAIAFAGIMVSGSLVFLGMQMSGKGLGANLAGGAELSDAQVTQIIERLKEEAQGGGNSGIVSASYSEIVDDDAFIGDEDAPVTLVEFSDYQCPFCHRHYSQTFSQLKSNFIETGKLKYVFRDFPLNFHADATPAAVAAECVRKQKGDAGYFAMHAKIFAGVETTGSIPRADLDRYASELSTNTSAFATCMADESMTNEVNADIAAGSQFGINGTPGFILTDGENSKLISGAQPFAVFKKEIEALLN